MICPKCGANLPDGTKFCGTCGSPLEQTPNVSQTPDPNAYVSQQPDPNAYVSQQPVNQQYNGQPVYNQAPPQGAYAPQGGYPPQGGYVPGQPQKKSKVWLVILIIVLALLGLIIGVAAFIRHQAQRAAQQLEEELASSIDDIEVDLEGLSDELDDFNFDIDPIDENLGDITSDISDDIDTTGDTSDSYDYEYEYVDVTVTGESYCVSPNGGLDGSTVLYGGKDLDGLLDYIDDEVLEPGRTINREMFYDLLAIDLIDETMYSEFEDIEMNLIMDLAMANNFHNLSVRVNSCEFDMSDTSTYNYNVTAEGRDDIWIVNYADNTVYFNNGKTEYSSDMFKDEYLAYWFVAVEDYYGLSSN